MNNNLEVIDTVRYRDKWVQHFIEKTVNSNMIFHRCWGDANDDCNECMKEQEITRLDGVEYQRGSWGSIYTCRYQGILT